MNPTVYLTAPAQEVLFQSQEGLAAAGDRPTGGAAAELPEISIDSGERFQEIDGFGYTLTGGSAFHLSRMSGAARAAILQELFGRGGAGIGVSYLRLSIGSSDLDAEVFSYNDLAPGETDPDMERFTLDPDREHLIPILKEILAINPEIRLMGSPWSAPVWMKSNRRSIGGSLLPRYYDAYARYFVKYVQGMAEEGIAIDAVTVQNEPLHGGNNPSMTMAAFEQKTFVRDHLGPAFESAGLDTRIVIYDHNADRPDYPLEILSDPEAAKYVDGTAFHLYGGEISALSAVHDAHPDKNLYFTEQWVGAPGDMVRDLMWHVENLIIGATRNWSRTVLEWNLAADPNQQPHTSGGCTRCLGAITIDGDVVTRNPAYYIIAHASKFVPPGSVRIGSTLSGELPNVAFQTPDGGLVLIVLNTAGKTARFQIAAGGAAVAAELPPRAVATYAW